MRIAIFSLAPVFQNAVHGGSQRTLRDVAIHLGRTGHTCKIFCTWRSDNPVPFELSPGVEVLPVLRFKEHYPEPYYSAPYHLREIITTLKFAVAESDVFYIHDAELYYHFIYNAVPTVVAVQDFVYPDTLGGCLSFRRDRLIVTSAYVKSALVSVFREFCDLQAVDVPVIPNGFDVHQFSRVDPTQLRRELNIPAEAICLLYPHRPDPRKGLYECITVLERLRKFLAPSEFDRVKLLIPQWMDSDVADDSKHVYQQLYTDVLTSAQEMSLERKIFIHKWIPAERMPEYLSLGTVTLCIGNFIEAFGNASVESLLCGTPAIVSRVGAQRSIIPDSLIRKIDYGDLDLVAYLVAEAIRSPQSDWSEVREYVSKEYSLSKTVHAYGSSITSCKLQSPIADKLRGPLGQEDRLEIPAWCALLEHGYYNDYEYSYVHDDRLVGLAKYLGDNAKHVGELLQRGYALDQIRRWVKGGHLVRLI